MLQTFLAKVPSANRLDIAEVSINVINAFKAAAMISCDISLFATAIGDIFESNKQGLHVDTLHDLAQGQQELVGQFKFA